jgi:hypothetical protein
MRRGGSERSRVSSEHRSADFAWMRSSPPTLARRLLGTTNRNATQWFGDAPIVLRTNRIAVCKIEAMQREELPAGARPLDIAFLEKDAPLPAAAREDSGTGESVDRSGRAGDPAAGAVARAVGSVGFLMHRHARARLPDGYGFRCVDRGRVIAELTRHGVEQTNVPYAWVTRRRARALLEP